MKLLLDLTTSTWLEHRKNHAAADKDYVTDQFDSDEGDKYDDDDDKDGNAHDDGNRMKGSSAADINSSLVTYPMRTITLRSQSSPQFL
ncbi:hypothetical protein PoB_001241900 [Plakobranchus ocellatus]|uniref:Uncharacterized protein n=1 Tax=Plakobranchus ocellatus TaxID=259542 RepID=A0AAV3YVZ9_9GAST|nr:hypothetical protein PoB_001241900 [Plakobranchus ocellatus]